MRVLHVISSGGMYGAESMILQLMRASAAMGDESAVGIFDNRAAPNEEFPAVAQRAGVAVERVVCRGQIDRTAPRRIAALARDFQADVVHTHGYKADLYCRAALRLSRAGRPALVATCHGWIDTGRVVKAYGLLDRRALRSFDGVVAVSEAIEQRLLGAGVRRGRVHLIANGIDAAPYALAPAGVGLRPEESAVPLVGQVGRLSREKGGDLFLRAMAAVRRAGWDARGVLWGEGPERAALEALRRELGLEGIVGLPGRRDDMPCALAELDVMVSASRQEGLPMALLEGMASGRAIVATAVGKVPDVLRNEATGLLIASEDVDALARSILVLLADRSRRQALGTAARREVHERFSAQAMATYYQEFYATALASVKRGGGQG